jgi:hypothetical protein
MDRTHLRWFTPATYADMFAACGYKVVSVGPLVRPSWRIAMANTITGGRLSHLFVSQIMLQAILEG